MTKRGTKDLTTAIELAGIAHFNQADTIPNTTLPTWVVLEMLQGLDWFEGRVKWYADELTSIKEAKGWRP